MYGYKPKENESTVVECVKRLKIYLIRSMSWDILEISPSCPIEIQGKIKNIYFSIIGIKTGLDIRTENETRPAYTVDITFVLNIIYVITTEEFL